MVVSYGNQARHASCPPTAYWALEPGPPVWKAHPSASLPCSFRQGAHLSVSQFPSPLLGHLAPLLALVRPSTNLFSSLERAQWVTLLGEELPHGDKQVMLSSPKGARKHDVQTAHREVSREWKQSRESVRVASTQGRLGTEGQWVVYGA